MLVKEALEIYEMIDSLKVGHYSTWLFNRVMVPLNKMIKESNGGYKLLLDTVYVDFQDPCFPGAWVDFLLGLADPIGYCKAITPAQAKQILKLVSKEGLSDYNSISAVVKEVTGWKDPEESPAEVVIACSWEKREGNWYRYAKGSEYGFFVEVSSGREFKDVSFSDLEF
jgi:hypothetical protein